MVEKKVAVMILESERTDKGYVPCIVIEGVTKEAKDFDKYINTSILF